MEMTNVAGRDPSADSKPRDTRDRFNNPPLSPVQKYFS